MTTIHTTASILDRENAPLENDHNDWGANAEVNSKQVSTILVDICQTAEIAIAQCHHAIEVQGDKNCSMEDLAQIICSTERLLQRIGWMADIAGGHWKGDASHWSLPPVFHDYAEEVQGAQ